MLSRQEDLHQAGRDRTCFTHIPPHVEQAVVLLHQCASSGKAQAQSGQWLQVPGLAVCAPDGLARYPDEERHPLHNPRAWSSGEEPVAQRELDDLRFIEEAVHRFQERLPAVTPVFLVGHSNGCAMAFRVLAESSLRDSFKGAVLYAAPWAGRKAALGTPLLYAAGDADPIRPFNGAERVHTPWFELKAMPVWDTLRDCMDHLGCTGALQSLSTEPGMTVMRWVGGVAPLEFRILHGQGHAWPAGQVLDASTQALVGPNSAHINLTTVALEFFSRCTTAAVPTPL